MRRSDFPYSPTCVGKAIRPNESDEAVLFFDACRFRAPNHSAVRGADGWGNYSEQMYWSGQDSAMAQVSPHSSKQLMHCW